MKKHLIIFTFILIILIVPFSIFINCMKTKSISNSKDFKAIKSEEVGVNKVNNVQYRIDESATNEENEAEAKEEVESNADLSEVKKTSSNTKYANSNVNNIVANNSIDNNVVENVVEEVKTVTDVLETQTGKLTSYGPDCVGCSGRVAYGQDVRNGNIYYNDKTYGQVRIVAGDKIYKFGTIVRIKNSKVGDNIIAIVLDRGGSVGIGKATMFDLLYTSNEEASHIPTSYNCTFEILRYGF